MPSPARPVPKVLWRRSSPRYVQRLTMLRVHAVAASRWGGAGPVQRAGDVEDPRWSDPFYQYRLAVEVQADATGWMFVPITAEQVTEAINALEEFHFDPLWFAFNQVRIERVTPNVGDDKLLVTAGFYLVPDSEELFTEPITGQDQQVSIPTEAGAYYLVRDVPDGVGGILSPACGLCVDGQFPAGR